MIIPPKLQSTVLGELHEGHLGISRMKALARSFVWWPRLNKDIKDLVRSCPKCQSCRNLPGHTVPHPWIFQKDLGGGYMQILQSGKGSNICC